MVQSIEDYSLQNTSNRINIFNFLGFFCWRAMYENACKGLHERTENYWGSFQNDNLESQPPLGIFLQDKIILDFFRRGVRCHVCSTRTSTQRISYFRVFLEKDHLSFSPRKKYHVFGKKKSFFQIVQERSCPGEVNPFRKDGTIFSEHLKKTSYFHVFS